MRKLKIISKGKATNGGILCFSPKPQDYIPHARVRLVKFKNEEPGSHKDSREFNGPLHKIMDDLEQYFLENLNLIGEEVKGFKRERYLEYPIEALREAAANAIAHRNYFDKAEVMITIYPSKLIISNPGSFPLGVTLSNPVHKARNPMLSNYLYDLGYVDKWGSGIKKMIELCRKHPVANIEFSIQPYNTKVTFSKNTRNFREKLGRPSREIMDLLETKKELSSGKISRKLGRSKPTILKEINLLINLGLVSKKGTGPAVIYSKKTA